MNLSFIIKKTIFGDNMNNPFQGMITATGKKAYQVLEDELKDIELSNATFYNLIDERGIPKKTHWDTVKKVAKALGYEIIFQKVSNSNG